MSGGRFGVDLEKQRDVAMARNPFLTQMPFRFSGIGLALASGRLNNDALAAELDVKAEWISIRCGVQSRCIARPDETTASLAIEAGRRALSVAGEPTQDEPRVAASQEGWCEHMFRSSGRLRRRYLQGGC
jgi:hypothetical protein